MIPPHRAPNSLFLGSETRTVTEGVLRPRTRTLEFLRFVVGDQQVDLPADEVWEMSPDEPKVGDVVDLWIDGWWWDKNGRKR